MSILFDKYGLTTTRVKTLFETKRVKKIHKTKRTKKSFNQEIKIYPDHQGSRGDHVHTSLWGSLTILGRKPVPHHGKGGLFQLSFYLFLSSYLFFLIFPYILSSFPIYSYPVLSYLIFFNPCQDLAHCSSLQTLSCDYTLDLPNFEHVSDAGKDFIKKLLVLDPSERHTAAQALQHPWLTDNRVHFSFFYI